MSAIFWNIGFRNLKGNQLKNKTPITDMETTVNDQEQDTIYPYLSDRVQSTFIDTVLIIVLMFIFSAILDKFENPPDWVRIVLFFGLFAIYEPLCMTFGCTLGNYIKKIRVRKHEKTTKRINIVQAIIRYIFKFTLGWISFITIHFNKERRAIHDFVAGSIMIKV